MRLNLGIRRRLAPLLDDDMQKIKLANSLLFTLPGSPALYYGDEIGMGDNIWLEDRDGLRTPMQWEPGPTAGFSETEPGMLFTPVLDEMEYRPDVISVSMERKDDQSLLNAIRRMIDVRKSHPELGSGVLKWLECDNQAIAAYLRIQEEHGLLIVHNLSSAPQLANLPVTIDTPTIARDCISGKRFLFPESSGINMHLPPLRFYWFELKPR